MVWGWLALGLRIVRGWLWVVDVFEEKIVCLEHVTVRCLFTKSHLHTVGIKEMCYYDTNLKDIVYKCRFKMYQTVHLFLSIINTSQYQKELDNTLSKMDKNSWYILIFNVYVCI